MKKLMRTAVAMLGLVAMTGFVPQAQAVINWTISPDGNALANSVTVVDGLAQFGSADTTQPVGIFGAGFTIVGNSASMNFDADLSTWDSYNAPSGPGTGWYDAFVVTISKAGYYWNLPHTDPIASSPSTFVWGGTNYADGILEHYITAPGGWDNVSLSSGFGTYYVSLVLDTKTLPNSDNIHPSWGSFHVSVVPEPETYAMLLAGLGLLAFTLRRRNNNNFESNRFA